MTITVRDHGETLSIPEEDVLFPMGRPHRPDSRMRCELWVFLHRTTSRVFVAGGEFGFDGLVREADDIEISALADRFHLVAIEQILARRVESRPK